MDGLGAVMREAGKSWYKFEKEEIWVRSSAGSGVDKPIQLSRLSPVVKGLETVRQGRIYVPLANRKEAEQRIRASSGGGKGL
jgi:hypothetical protein